MLDYNVPGGLIINIFVYFLTSLSQSSLLRGSISLTIFLFIFHSAGQQENLTVDYRSLIAISCWKTGKNSRKRRYSSLPLLVGASNGYLRRNFRPGVLYELGLRSFIYVFFFLSYCCSFKPFFWFSMTSWTIQSRAADNPVGSEYQRCENRRTMIVIIVMKYLLSFFFLFLFLFFILITNCRLAWLPWMMELCSATTLRGSSKTILKAGLTMWISWICLMR